jgi:hypothetical protein
MSPFASAYRKARGTWFLFRNGSEELRQAGDGLVVDIDIHKYRYARYFYSFVKFLRLEGHTVALRARPETIHLINRSQYANGVLEERLVSLGGAAGSHRLCISDRGGQITLEPYDFIPSQDPSAVDIPMAQHPAMYAYGYWNQPVMPPAPEPTILFLGNSSSALYSRITKDGLFDVIDRVSLNRILRSMPVCHTAEPGRVMGPNAPGIQMIDSADSYVAMKDFRQVVAGYGFFLCSPGVFMPLCHNLVEAMSVGTIPIVQRAYADLMVPPLTGGENAVVFNDETDLLQQVHGVLQMPASRIMSLREGVLKYYEGHLTPRAVVAKVLAPGVRKIRMLAGDHSLSLLRKARQHAAPTK